MTESDVLDTGGAADYLQLAPRTLMRWRVEKAGPPYLKLGVGTGSGGVVRYRRSDLDAWLAGQLQTPTG